MQDNLLTRIQNWYKTNCNGDWEHSYGFSIDNLDNPGWLIKIDLSETCLENLKFERKDYIEKHDWLFIETKNKVLEASCDPNKLSTVLQIFLDEIIPIHADKNFLYDIYIAMSGASTETWQLAKARMINEDTLEIVEIPKLNYKDIKLKKVEDFIFKEEDNLYFKTKYAVGDKVKLTS